MIKKTLIILSTIVFSMVSAFGQFEKCSSFDELESLSKAYAEKNSIDSSILAMEYALRKFPNEEEKAINVLGLLYTRNGNTTKAIEIWAAGLEKGHYYGLNRNVYKSYYTGNSVFEKLIEIERNRNNLSHIKYETVLPADYISNKPYPILFIFHGNFSNIEKEKDIWISKLMKDKFISVFVQSYAHATSIDYRWLYNDDKTKDEFITIYNNLMATYKIDTNNIVFTGMSAGGKIVLDFAFNEIVPITGIILNCPVVPDNINDSAIIQFIKKNKKIGIITGEKDFAFNNQKELINRVNSQQGLNKFTINKNIGHVFAENFPDLLDEYLKWILE